MNVSAINVTNGTNGIGFRHKIIMDIGASNPKGTLKIKALSELGETILRENSPNSFLNNTVNGFDGAAGFIKRISDVIRRTHERVLLKHKSGEFPLTDEDKALSGVAVFVPGTTYSKGKGKNIIAFMPNLKDKTGESLTNVDFTKLTKMIKTGTKKETGINANKELFDLVVTKDLGGAGVGLAKLMAKKKMLQEGDYIMGIMTGGGFGSVDLKVRNKKVDFETSESSSYVAGNCEVYPQISKLLDVQLKSSSPEVIYKKLTADNNKLMQEKIQILGKLGRQGVNVKSHIESFCTGINRPDLFPLLSSIGDARIVEMNRLCVSEKDADIISKLRSMPEFVEVESTTDGKIAFEMDEGVVGRELLRKARIGAVNDYANAISLISINKINDCLNKVVLLGPFAHGVNQYIKTHPQNFDNAKDLPELIERKIRTNIDENHINLPSTRRLMDLYKFEIICDKDLNIPDNTFAGELFLKPSCKFTPNRGSWFSIPIKDLKNS